MVGMVGIGEYVPRFGVWTHTVCLFWIGFLRLRLRGLLLWHGLCMEWGVSWYKCSRYGFFELVLGCVFGVSFSRPDVLHGVVLLYDFGYLS